MKRRPDRSPARPAGRVVALWMGTTLAVLGCGTRTGEPGPAPPPAPQPAPAIPLAGSVSPPPSPGTRAPGRPHGEVAWDTPDAFESETPSSSMRRAQYRLPGPEGEGRCLVFYFGPGQGGPVDANLERWAKQFTPEDGTPPLEAARLEKDVTSSGWPVTWIRTRGTYANPMAAEEPREGYALLAAIVETPGGNWFFKCTGPEATMTSHEEAIRRWVRSVRPPSPSGP